MTPGTIVEYIDRQKIVCAVVLEIKKPKLHLLNEQNREVSLSSSRILHTSKNSLDLSAGRDELIRILKKTAHHQAELIKDVNIRELWEVLYSEQQWIDAATIAELCFPNNADSNSEAGVIRAFFQNRTYFKFDQNRFFPYTENQVDQMIAQTRETERQNRIIDAGVALLKQIADSKKASVSKEDSELVKILKSAYLYNKESEHFPLTQKILAKAGIRYIETLFDLLVKINAFDQNENLDLYRLGIPIEFSDSAVRHATGLLSSGDTSMDSRRTDLTRLETMTIDGPNTKDFDDALSIEHKGNDLLVGIHIIDVGHFIQKNDVLDEEAFIRGSSIYMPDAKIPMLPQTLSEDLCSLKAGVVKPAISIMVTLSAQAKVIDYHIIPSYINVKQQLTFSDVDELVDENKDIRSLFNLAKNFRNQRFMNGAVHISLPEINLFVDDAGEVQFSRVDRENPGRFLVAEMMIMANWLSACFLAKHQMPAVFRSQPEPKERLYRGEEGTLFQNYMQRRHLSRFKLDIKPESHSGLGLEAYVTNTSPIRKYYDLVTQRQIRAILGLESPYRPDEINGILQHLEIPLANIGRVQFLRNRYWILKYLEKKTGDLQEAVVLLKRKNHYQILLPEVMIECELPTTPGIKFKPEDLIHVKIQHVDARKNTLSVFLS